MQLLIRVQVIESAPVGSYVDGILFCTMQGFNIEGFSPVIPQDIIAETIDGRLVFVQSSSLGSDPQIAIPV